MHWYFYVPLRPEPVFVNVCHIYNNMSPNPTPALPIAALLILPRKLIVYRENPAKYPSLAKNPPKYCTAYIVQ